MQKVKFSPNVPQQMTFESPGVRVSGRFGDQVRYSLADGRVLYADPPLSETIDLLNVEPGESFHICKRWNGSRKTKPYWDAWLSTDTEKQRSIREAMDAPQCPQDTPLLSTLRESIRIVQSEPKSQPAQVQAVTRMPEVTAELAPTGTEGPRPQRLTARPPVKIPFNVAFREVLQFVTQGLKEAGEQWNDAAKQDLISTVLIQGSKEGWIHIWERVA